MMSLRNPDPCRLAAGCCYPWACAHAGHCIFPASREAARPASAAECRPPPEHDDQLWHWVRREHWPKGAGVLWLWDRQRAAWKWLDPETGELGGYSGRNGAAEAHCRGWRYICPVAPPASQD